MDGATAARGLQPESVEALERDLERGKPLFRRKRGKVRNLDDSGHKGLADFLLRAARYLFSYVTPPPHHRTTASPREGGEKQYFRRRAGGP